MEVEKKYDVEAIANRLEDYVLAEQDIDREIERLEYLTAQLTSLGSQVMTGMPRATNASTDRMADKLGRKEELELSIKVAIEAQAAERKCLEEIIRHLRNPDERSVIRLRYLDRTDWSDVLEVMYGMKPDFNDKFDSYRRKMYRARETALVNMAKYISEAE